MTNFVTIDPRTATVELVSAKQLTDVYHHVGLNSMEVDHGTVAILPNQERICIVVYEYGLRKPKEQGKYFSIGPLVYEGGAVVYATDVMGETVSINHKPPVVFYRDYLQVELAIAGGEVVWSWPSEDK